MLNIENGIRKTGSFRMRWGNIKAFAAWREDSMIVRSNASRLPIFILLALGLLLVLHPAAAVPQVHAQATTSQTEIAVNPTAIAGLNHVTGTTVTFDVNVTHAPAINSFAVSIQYSPKVLQAISIDFSSSSSFVLGQSAAAYSECIDGVSLIGGICTPLDDVGVVTLGASELGSNTGGPTSGPLFNVTFNVIHQGFSEIHFLTAQVAGCNSAGICGQQVTSLNVDGYFSDIDCFSGTLCTPPAVSVSYSPSIIFTGEPIVFDASKSSATNPGATIVNYAWVWGGGEGSNTTTVSSITHVFTNQGDHIFTLSVTDSYGIIELISVPIPVSAPLEVFSISANPASLTIVAGAMGTTQLSIVNLDGIIEAIQLAPSLPTGFSAALSTTTIHSSGSAELNLTATMSVSPGTYLVNVTGATNELTRTATIAVTVPAPDFSISPAQTTTINCTARSTCNTTITITPENGFSGIVRFAVSVSDGLTCNTPSPVSGSGTTILGCSAIKPGDYSATVTGSSGSLSHGTGPIAYNVVPAPHAHHPHQHEREHDDAHHPDRLDGEHETIAVTVDSLNGASTERLLQLAESFVARFQPSVVTLSTGKERFPQLPSQD